MCGSAKFPVKEPFVDLIKSSMQTFLNAMTYPDKTVYPVASTNEQDLLNLMDVYMDAVLNPAIYTKPSIFEHRKGWHYELDVEPGQQLKDGTLRYNGVVFNEMKGALHSMSVLDDAVNRALFPTTAYARESGGDPRAIPQLTYGEFLDTHARHYNLANSYIVLYGDMHIERELAFLDERYLADDRLRDEAARAQALQATKKHAGAGTTDTMVRTRANQRPAKDDARPGGNARPGGKRASRRRVQPDGKRPGRRSTRPAFPTRPAFLTVGGRPPTRSRRQARHVRLRARGDGHHPGQRPGGHGLRAGQRRGPQARHRRRHHVRRTARQQRGTGEKGRPRRWPWAATRASYTSGDQLQPHTLIILQNAQPGRARVRRVIEDECRRLAEEGIPRDRLAAVLANEEFDLRQRDFGIADGVAIACDALGTWLYEDTDEAATRALEYGSVYDELKQALDTTFFEDLLREIVLGAITAPSWSSSPWQTTRRPHARRKPSSPPQRQRSARQSSSASWTTSRSCASARRPRTRPRPRRPCHACT